MKGNLSLKRPEVLDAVIRHPVAGALGGVVMALLCAGIGSAVSSPTVALMMALVGLVIGAPGGAHIAASIKRE
jgi:uncharacterized YccA/Bax inhibitor family protein